MIHSKHEQPDEVFEFAAEYERLCQRLGFRKPLVCVPTTYNQVTEETLKAHGFNLVIYANHLLALPTSDAESLRRHPGK